MRSILNGFWRFTKSLLLLIFILALALSMIALWPNTNENNDFSDSSPKTDSIKQSPAKEDAFKETALNLAIEMHDLEFMNESDVTTYLQDVFRHYAVIEYDPTYKNFKIVPAHMDFVEFLSVLNEPFMRDKSLQLQTDMVETSELISHQLGNGYSLTIVSPGNPENGLIIISDGVVLSSVIN